MNINNLSTEKLEAMDARITRTIMAMKSWANRNMSKASRKAVVDELRIQQDAIMVELMKREGVVA